MLIYILIHKIVLLQILIPKNILTVIFSARRKKDIANLPKEDFRPTLAYCKFKV